MSEEDDLFESSPVNHPPAIKNASASASASVTTSSVVKYGKKQFKAAEKALQKAMKNILFANDNLLLTEIAEREAIDKVLVASAEAKRILAKGKSAEKRGNTRKAHKAKINAVDAIKIVKDAVEEHKDIAIKLIAVKKDVKDCKAAFDTAKKNFEDALDSDQKHTAITRIQALSVRVRREFEGSARLYGGKRRNQTRRR